MQPTNEPLQKATRRLLAAASLLSLTALISLPSTSAASSPRAFGTSIGPVSPVGVHAGRFGDSSAAAGTLKRGVNYGGKTSQGEPFVLGLSRAKTSLVRLALDIEATCTSGSTLSSGGDLTAHLRVAKTGGFKGTVLSSIDGATETGAVAIDVTGKLGSSRGSGTAHVHIDFVDKQSGTATDACDTGTFRWGTTSAKGRVYGGSTSQHDPVVVELTRDLRQVSTLRIGWQAPCSPQGGIHGINALTKFPLSRSRAFGDTFSMTQPADGGGQDKLDYQVQGKAGRSKASGRIQVHITRTDATGATLATCDSGAVSWRAASG